MTGLRIGSLFSGYGGLEQGVQAVLGGSTAWVSDIDKGACKILAHRYPNVPNLGDITAVDWSTVEPVDILTGGSPCQDLSHAGKRSGMTEGTRSNLWVAMREAIAQLRPGLVVWENVRGAYSAAADSALEHCPRCMGDPRNRGPVLRALGRVLGDLADLGYDAGWHGLRAADIGAPHGRFRVFVTAWDATQSTRGAGFGGWSSQGAPRAASRSTPLLPTPTSSDTNGPGAHGDGGVDGGVDLRTAVSLLGTPTASDWKGSGPVGSPSHDAMLGRAHLTAQVTALLPTPAVNDEQQRILDRSEVGAQTGCWLWTGWTNQAATPYGRLDINGVKVYAHRAAYEAFVGPIPQGHEIDHLCQTSLCVNPEHLEAVTPEENRDRVTQRRTHCKRGHEFTEDNIYWVRPGARACRACRTLQDRARRKGKETPLLPTPACNDMGEGKTVEAWDEWTAKMKAAHGNGNGHGASLAIEAQRLLPTPRSTRGGSVTETAYAFGGERTDDHRPQGEVALNWTDWGQYADAIARWEHLTRTAPAPTQPSKKGTPQLSPAFSEWMMGLPAGWVADVPGITRNEALKALGNGVVWQQAAAALRFLLAVQDVAA